MSGSTCSFQRRALPLTPGDSLLPVITAWQRATDKDDHQAPARTYWYTCWTQERTLKKNRQNSQVSKWQDKVCPLVIYKLQSDFQVLSCLIIFWFADADTASSYFLFWKSVCFQKQTNTELKMCIVNFCFITPSGESLWKQASSTCLLHTEGRQRRSQVKI